MYDSVAVDSSTKRISDSQLTSYTVVFIKGSPRYELRGPYNGFLALSSPKKPWCRYSSDGGSRSRRST
jgi:hypothetical protein